MFQKLFFFRGEEKAFFLNGVLFLKTFKKNNRHFKKSFKKKDFIFKEKGEKRFFFFFFDFLRIVCRENVLPKHIYFMTHY